MQNLSLFITKTAKKPYPYGPHNIARIRDLLPAPLIPALKLSRWGGMGTLGFAWLVFKIQAAQAHNTTRYFLFFFFLCWRLAKRNIYTARIYYYVKAKFYCAERDSRHAAIRLRIVPHSLSPSNETWKKPAKRNGRARSWSFSSNFARLGLFRVSLAGGLSEIGTTRSLCSTGIWKCYNDFAANVNYS